MFFFLALLPIIIWAIQWRFNKKIVWKEAAIGAGAALVMATVFHIIENTEIFVPTSLETRSGRVEYAQYQPRWREYYEEAIYRTETYECGTSEHPQTCTREVFSHWESRRRWHPARWWVITELGNFSISKRRFKEILEEFGGSVQVEGLRRTSEHASRMIEGSPWDIRSFNANNYIYPVTDNTKFKNRLLKSTTSLYNFESVSDELVKEHGLIDWPENIDRFDTDRLLGTLDYDHDEWKQRKWDQMNAILGPSKKVNVIAIGFPEGTPTEVGSLQERYWKGGKKNDLVIVLAGPVTTPEWVYVFGWTERELVKRLLESRISQGGALIEDIHTIIKAEYELLNFEEKFKHVEVPTPWWYYLIFFIVVGVSQFIAHRVFENN
jgi:hypothetical protein